MPMTDAQLLERMNRHVPPTALLLGTRILSVDSAAGRVRMSFQPSEQMINPMGNVQGGFLVAMLDDAAAIAAIVKSGKRIAIPTIELKTSFFAPAKAGMTLYADAVCLKLGKRVAFMEAELRDEAGTLLAKLSTSAVPIPLPDDAIFVETT
ncbi:PaaI family thioesterase [Glacieibacterium sp.]|uniref:PaaI family thioesterase n=1 Tax=Glacieibacterium sp. TaxID=2860237 RepID=UPI003B009C5D